MSTSPSNDPLLERLEALPRPDLEAHRAAGILRRTRGAFEKEAALARSPWLRWGARAWNQVLEPLTVAALVLLYAGWGLSTSAALLAERPAPTASSNR